jgi:hypothetical protein
MKEYTFLILDDIPVTIWRDGTVDIHVPNTKASGTCFGLGWERYQSFKGKLIGSWHSLTVTNPKVGQQVRLYNVNAKHPSLPVVVRAVYHNGNPMETLSLWKMVESHPQIIGNNHGFTSFGEDAKYSVTIARFLTIAHNQKSDHFAEGLLVDASKGDYQTSDIYSIIHVLIKARIIYKNNNDIVADTSLYYILMQAINRMHAMKSKPFLNSN